MKKYLSKIVTVVFAMAILFAFAQTEVKASEGLYLKVNNAAGETLETFSVDTNDAEDGIQDALDYIRANNSGTTAWIVVFPEGDYIIDNTLNVYSNTTLDLSAGVTLYRDEELTSTMIRIGNQEKDGNVYGYDAYQNITIIGAKNNYAVLDGSGVENALLRFGHATNVKVQYVEFTNVTKAHHAEFAGCKDVLVDSCKFTEFHPFEEDDGTNYEALQLDVLEEYHFPNYPAYDNSVNQNITITNNEFNKVNRGVGAHSGHVGRYMKNVNISNNTFTDVNGYAIVATNFMDSTITNNKIEKAGSGIYFRHITYDYINYYAGESANVNTNLNSVISNNTISLKETSFDNARFGIRVFGEKLSKNVSKDGNTIPKGDYRVSNVKVENNNISSTTFANGVWLQGVMNSSVKNNTISYKIASLATSDECDGVKLEKSVNNTLTNNKVYDNSKEKAVRYGFHIKDASNNNVITSSVVENVVNSGIYVISSTGCNVSKNTISNPGEFGIYLSTKADATVSSNTITKSGSNGIYLNYASKSSLVEKNTITNSGSNGIHLNDKSAVTKLAENKITSSKGQGIYLNGKASCGDMEKNTIASAKEQGIYITEGASVTNINSNSITSPSKCGIYVNGGTVSYILKNTISNAKQAGIGMAGKSSVTTIGENVIAATGSHGIYALGNAECTNVQLNAISSAAEQGIYLNGKAAMKNIIYNTITDSAKCGVYINGGTVEMIAYNAVQKNANKTSATNGIYIAAASQKIASISSNSISDASQIALGIVGTAEVATIENNAISNAGSHGLYACDSAKVDKVNKNSIVKSGQQGVYLTGSATLKDITSNTITDSQKCGIYINGGYVTTISKNTINKAANKKSSVNGIYVVAVKKQISKIASNIISDTSKTGIGLDGKMTVASIEKNTLKNIGSQGIYIAKTANAKKINKNNINKAKENGIFISSTKASGKIESNTIKRCSKYGMDIAKSAKITAKNNTVSSCKSGQVLIRGSKNKGFNTSKFKIKSVSKKKKTVVIKWAKSKNIKEYVIYRSTSKNGKYTKIGTTTKSSYTDKKVKKNKTYYYKIVPVAKYSKTTVEFPATAVKKIKFK